MDSNLKRNIILEHYQNPKNRGLTNDDSYIKINMNNESCIDEVNLEVKIEDNIIKDIHFDGEACAMCISSSSIMVETLIGKTIEDEKDYDPEVLESAIVYDDTYKQPNRKKCVLLSWWGVEKILKELDKN